mgnify:CR=1 FL=1
MIILTNYIDKIVIFITSGFGVGYAPFAQGTFGSIIGLATIISLIYIQIELTFISLLLIIFISSLLCHRANQIYKNNDSKHIVLDEIVGIFVATYDVPLTFINFFICFLFFRIFDILKPYPISFIDKELKNGFGIVFDDVLAGIFANILFIIIANYFLNTS